MRTNLASDVPPQTSGYYDSLLLTITYELTENSKSQTRDNTSFDSKENVQSREFNGTLSLRSKVRREGKLPKPAGHTAS